MNTVPSVFEPELHRIRLNGVKLAYWERGQPRSDKPTLLFVHATGFHGRVYDRVIEAFPGFHVISYEQRGHGRSEHSPVTIMRAKEPSGDDSAVDFSISPTWPEFAGEFPDARDIHLKECTHFIPMQMPDEMISVIREEVSAWEDAQ